MLPFSCATDSYSCSSSQAPTARITSCRCPGPRRNSADAIIVTSAPAISSLITSWAVWTPVLAAKEIFTWLLMIAIQRSGISDSYDELRLSVGTTFMPDSEMLGYRKRLNRTNPLAPAIARRWAMFAIAEKYGPTLTASGMEMELATSPTRST